MSKPDSNPPQGQETIASRAHPLRRLGCLVLLVLWFVFLLLPCFLIFLATQQEIIISQGGLPGQAIRVWLIMEPEQRGIGFSYTRLQSRDDGQQCLQTQVNYMLWQGSEANTIYCDCFAPIAESDSWHLIKTYPGVCTG